MATLRYFLFGLLYSVGLFGFGCSPTPTAKLPQQAVPAQVMSLTADSLAMSILPDSLQVAIEAARKGSICTLDRLIGVFKEQVWLVPNEAQRILAWNQQPDLVRWMGIIEEEDSSEIEFFWQMLQDMRHRLTEKEVKFQLEDSWLGHCNLSDSRAFVKLRDREPTIYLCPAWLDQSPSHRIATVLHELVHTFGYGHPRGTDFPQEALALARDYPKLARRSPENYESLVELYICLFPER